MALPPERISIKRRRADEPVTTLILEDTPHDTKRRFTEFIFQRLRSGTGAGAGPSSQTRGATAHAHAHAHADAHVQVQLENAGPRSPLMSTPKPGSRDAEYRALGIPVVRATRPGDEVQGYAKYRPPLGQGEGDVESALLPITRKGRESKGSRAATRGHTNDAEAVLGQGHGIPMEKIKSARRFRLTRDISSALRPHSAGGIRRRKLNLRPPLATFVEQKTAAQTPIDRIVQVNEPVHPNASDVLMPDEVVTGSKTPVKTFSKPAPVSRRDGHSIQDDPSTWDVESDRLADELAALAFEMDPDAAAADAHAEEPSGPVAKIRAPEPMIVDSDDDFVFETYVRVRRDANPEFQQVGLDDDIGILIIGDEDHDLWEKYVHEDDDDDDDWDEEDEDSNAEDNPRNDYPEDEVSSDDELGRNAYRYRRNASDDEQFDHDREWS